MEEERFVIGFHWTVEKQRHKSWHDRHIRVKPFAVGGLVLLYDNKFFKQPIKLRTHWLGPYLVVHITDASVVKLQKLDDTYVMCMVNDSFLKPYYDGHNILG